MTFYGEDQVRAVQEATDLVALFAERSKVVKAGADYVCCCPIHNERTPSLHIYASERRWYCFGCKKRGDAIDLVRELDGVDFEQALEQLARRVGIQLRPQGGARAVKKADDRARRIAAMEFAAAFYEQQFGGPEAKPARDYLAGRGFTEATLAAFGVGWAPGRGALVRAATAAGHVLADLVELDLAVQRDGRTLDRFFDRITIPIRDRRGQVVAFTARLLPEAEAAAQAAGRGVGKYVNSRDTPLYQKGDTLFNLAGAQLGRRLGCCRMVEGPLDVMASHQAGVRAIVATCGTALTPAHAQALRAALGDDADLIIALDGDAAGRSATTAAVRVCLAAGLRPLVGCLPGGKDAAAVLVAPPVELAARPAELPTANDAEAALACLWDQCHAEAVDGLTHLLRASEVTDDTAPADRLAAIDTLLAVAGTLPDQRLVELDWLQRISDHLAVPLKTVRETWKRSAPAKPASAGEAAPAAQGGGGDYHNMVTSLEAHIAAIGARPDAMCGWLDAHGAAADLSDNDVLLRFTHSQRMANRRIIDHELKSGLTVIISDRREARRRELLSTLVGQPATDAGRDALRRWLQGATGAARPLDVAVMTHFVWQVKRLALGRDTDWDIIPVLYGGQGLGKTISVERFCRPLAELSFPIDASAITDERKAMVVTRALVGRLEEMAGMAKADAEKLKAMATARSAVFRELYTMSVQQRRRTCSFIASSNLPLDAIINDTTGVRRFYQINCDSKDWDLINSIDPAQIWQCVSEDDDAPLKAVLRELRAAQAMLVHHDVVALWLRSDAWQALAIRRGDSDHPLLIGAYNPECGYLLDELAARCAYWARGTSNSPPTLPRFKLRLHQEGFLHKRVLMPGGRERQWRWFIPDRYRAAVGGPDNRAADWGGADETVTPPAAPVEDFPA